MRPVNKGADPPYTSKTTFSFSGKNATPIKAVVPVASASNVPISDCLGVWLREVKGSSSPGTPAQLATAVSAIKNQVGNLYKLASVPLTERIGPFCSFCETPLPGLLEVEHCAPKANYPTFSVTWNNFLLACSPCNTAKGNSPDRATVKGWIGTPAPTESQYYAEIREARYVWPDLDSHAFDWMPIELQYKDGSTWEAVDDGWAYNCNCELISTDIATRTVIARLVNPASPYNYVDVEVRAYVQGTSASNGQAAEMIRLCGLNDVKNLDSTYDRRVMNRTIAWFTYLHFYKALSQAVPAMKPTFLKMLEMMAVATGFYSVWLQCLQYNDDDLAQKFVTDTNAAGAYPGTDTTHLP